MFIPLYDSNGLEHIDRQYVTIGLIIANVAIWLVTGLGASEQTSAAISFGFGFVPSVVFDHARLDPSILHPDDGWTFLTYAFLHGGFWHLLGNMVFLWVFGDNVEDAMGHVRFLFFYLACAAAGALVHGVVAPASDAPLIGASGAVAGVVAAYFLLHPKVTVWILVFFKWPLPLPAALPLALWIGQQFWLLVVDRDGTVSWGAHVGGILAGLLLIVLLKRRAVPLFDREIVTPRSVHVASPPPGPDEPRPPPPWGRAGS